MAPRKPVPQNSTDRRRVHPIDELRAQTWIQYVRSRTELTTNYALAKRFGGEAKKWTNYCNGGQPNDDVLNCVDREIPGSKSCYTSGPSNLKLWPALGLNERQQLQLISDNSEEVDGEIARLQIEAATGAIPVDFSSGCIGDELHPYDLRLSDINHQLRKVLPKELASRALDILSEALQPYRDKADRLAKEDFFDSISSGRSSYADVRRIASAEDYLLLEVGTIKMKGRRTNDE